MPYIDFEIVHRHPDEIAFVTNDPDATAANLEDMRPRLKFSFMGKTLATMLFEKGTNWHYRIGKADAEKLLMLSRFMELFPSINAVGTEDDISLRLPCDIMCKEYGQEQDDKWVGLQSGDIEHDRLADYLETFELSMHDPRHEDNRIEDWEKPIINEFADREPADDDDCEDDDAWDGIFQHEDDPADREEDDDDDEIDAVDDNAFPGFEHKEPEPEEQASMDASIEQDAEGNDYLMVVIPVSKDQRVTPSGRSIVIASTGGFRQSNITVKGVPVMIGVSAFIPVFDSILEGAEPEPQDPNAWDGINRIITL